MARRHGRPAGRIPHRSSGRRIALLAGAAALGAVGVNVIGPAAPALGLTAHASDASAQIRADRAQVEAASRGMVRDPLSTAQAMPAQAASAIPQAQARAHTIADINAQRTAATASAAPGAPAAGPDAYRAYARSKVGDAQFGCLNKLWNRESNWRPTAQNPSSTAYGIAQLLDSTWAYTGVAKTSDGFRQVDAGLAYVRAAYGSPCAAWAHETAHGWY